jgi:hypothetical protein
LPASSFTVPAADPATDALPVVPQATPANWPAQTTALPHDGLRAVGYVNVARR